MCLIFQGIRVQVQVLKPANLSKNQVKNCCSLKLDRYLDRCIYQDLICEAQQIARQLYLSRIMKFKFPDMFFTYIQAICVGFLFSQSYTYIRIILRAIKGDAKGFIDAYCDQIQSALVHISLEEAVAFVR